METFTYIYEALFFLLGLYLLFFSFGWINIKDSMRRIKMEEARKSYNPWLKIFSIFLVVIYGILILLHFL